MHSGILIIEICFIWQTNFLCSLLLATIVPPLFEVLYAKENRFKQMGPWSTNACIATKYNTYMVGRAILNESSLGAW